MLQRLALLSLSLAALGSSVSCMTTYDSYGRPMQSVDPGLAIAGVAAAGLVGYAVANNRNHGGHHGGHVRYESYDTHRYHDDGGGYYGGYDHCY